MSSEMIEEQSPTGPASVGTAAGGTVSGERTIPSVNERRSIQNRVNHLLALMVVTLVGGGFLFVYYSRISHATVDAKTKAAQERTAKASGEMKLPPLGRVEAPRTVSESTVAPELGPTALSDVLGPAPPLAPMQSAAGGAATSTAATAATAAKTPAQLALDRQLTPSVFLRTNDPIAGNAVPNATSTNTATSPTGRGELSSYLSPAIAAATHAQVLSSRRFIIPKGNFLDCTLETAINSELPGMTTCVTAFDIFGADGKVVLLERGSKLVGETRGQVAQGMSRLFVLWSEARTPSGVVVQLDSPGTDELGRSGVTGTVNTHFWSRFGAALLVTVIDGALQGVAQSQERSGSTVVLNPQGGQQVIDDILRSSINIPPTISVNPGSRIQVIVARDVDFRSVYDLRMASDP